MRVSSTMRKVALLSVGLALLCLVYTLDVTKLLKGSINYMGYHAGTSNQNPTRTYECRFNSCRRTENEKNDTMQNYYLETCNMLCGNLPLWPKPSSANVTKRNMTSFIKNEMSLVLNAPNEIESDIREAYSIFMTNLPGTYDPSLKYDEKLNILINVNSSDKVLTLSSDESYHLTVLRLEKEVKIYIQSVTFFGARHGLETLSQLIWYNDITKKLNIVHDVEIRDSPKFPYRGLMVDTARSYFHVAQLKKVLDGMAASKLNVFHLHLTDASSFPIVLPRNEMFAKYAAYSAGMVYTAQDIKDLVDYARIRGIRVILEVDAPSHVSQDLNRAKKDLVICGDEARFNGHLNPKNSQTLRVLEDIYKDLLDLGTDSEIFHLGGDEVNLSCWDRLVVKPTSSPEITKDETTKLFIDFTNDIFDTLKSANKQTLPRYVVIWSSDLMMDNLESYRYKENIVVQYWQGPIKPILDKGNKVIFSTVGKWYLDCGYGSWSTDKDIGGCNPYATWHTFYNYQPWVHQFSKYIKQILGGEACLWSETVNADTLETRIWPRTAALAERLWSDPDVYERVDVYKRLDIHRERLNRRGIKSEAVWPLWCSQNPTMC